jgi:hypothetical protein
MRRRRGLSCKQPGGWLEDPDLQFLAVEMFLEE